MPQPSQQFLRVRDAPVDDYDKLIVRLHKAAKPDNLEWGDYMHISADAKHWVTVKLQPSGKAGSGKIYISPHIRILLNSISIGILPLRLEEGSHIYIKRASRWKEPLYIIRYHPDDSLRVKMRLRVCAAMVVITAFIFAIAYIVYLLLPLI